MKPLSAIALFFKNLFTVPVDPRETDEYQKFVESCVHLCRCRSQDCPCDGVLAGGVCDNIQDDPDRLDLADKNYIDED